MSKKMTLNDVLENIKDPHKWADYESLVEVIRTAPSVRGMVYGNVSEVQLAKWLVSSGIPSSDQQRDDDHLKTKADRTIIWKGKQYTIQVKSLQTNSIREVGEGQFTAKIQCDASDRRRIKLPSGNIVNTTCYASGEFDILAVALQPFTGSWEFVFMKNSDLSLTTYNKYSDEDRKYLLKTLVDIEYPLNKRGDWTTDLLGLLSSDSNLGTNVT